jgi:hypothetical protein
MSNIDTVVVVGKEVVGNDSGLCPMASVGISSV